MEINPFVRMFSFRRGNDPAMGYQVVNNAVLAFAKGHPFIGEFISRWTKEYNPKKKIWAVIIGTVYVNV